MIGRELQAIKMWLPHGEYRNWLEIEFGLSERMAQRFVGVYKRLGSKSDKLSVLAPSTLYLLAAPSTPDAVIRAVENRLEHGTRVSVLAVQRAVAAAKQSGKQPKAGAVTPAACPVPQFELVGKLDADQIEAARHLDAVLTQAFTLLLGKPAAEWVDLFHNSELRRIGIELYKLREEVRAQLLRVGLSEADFD